MDRAGSLLDPFGVTVTLKINTPAEGTKGDIEGFEPSEVHARKSTLTLATSSYDAPITLNDFRSYLNASNTR